MQKLNKEKALLEKSVNDYRDLKSRSDDAQVMVEMVKEAEAEAAKAAVMANKLSDSGPAGATPSRADALAKSSAQMAEAESLFKELKTELKAMLSIVKDLEIKSFLSGELDGNGAFITVHSGAGGTESCDWAEMLFRMYVRYSEARGYKTEIMSLNQGEEAGIKSVTISVEGPFAYGYLKAESGVHRLVRISPFDSNARRHTSFASVMVYPEISDDIEVVIKTEDLKVDTYRASGAGGQHVNKTDSAVRITHIPTGIIIACQNQRSQHENRDRAMKMLKAALYELELEKRQKEKDALDSQKKANEWGSQIRSYVLHPYQLIKDHRTDWESSQPQKVLDGELDPVIEAYLKTQVKTSANAGAQP
jgi:peptide chain release factor 2